MKAATVKEIKTELSYRSQKELVEIILRLSKFKKENKELLTYLLYESENESSYVQSVKKEMDSLFNQMNKTSFYYIKKSTRKILSIVKKYIRYSQKKETEVDLLIYFCMQFRKHVRGYKKSTAMKNLYGRQTEAVIKALNTLHEDIQFDYQEELERILEG